MSHFIPFFYLSSNIENQNNQDENTEVDKKSFSDYFVPFSGQFQIFPRFTKKVFQCIISVQV